MKMALETLLVAALAFAITASAADAQEQKKTKQRQQPQTSSSDYTGGLPSCHGGMVILEEGQSVLCRRRDGKTCEVREGTSGMAVVGNCK